MTVLLVVAGLAAANRYAPGVVQAVLALTVLYLAVTHADKLGAAFTGASANLARSFGASPASAPGPGGGGGAHKR